MSAPKRTWTEQRERREARHAAARERAQSENSRLLLMRVASVVLVVFVLGVVTRLHYVAYRLSVHGVAAQAEVRYVGVDHSTRALRTKYLYELTYEGHRGWTSVFERIARSKVGVLYDERDPTRFALGEPGASFLDVLDSELDGQLWGEALLFALIALTSYLVWKSFTTRPKRV
jgi:hypothetical protein